MKVKIIIIFFLMPMFVISQNPQDNQLKYWYYRDRLKWFVMPGYNHGQSIVSNIRNRDAANPAEDFVKIDLPSNSSLCRVDLLSCAGLVVRSVEFGETSYILSLSDVSSGIYVLRLAYDQKIETFKLIIE